MRGAHSLMVLGLLLPASARADTSAALGQTFMGPYCICQPDLHIAKYDNCPTYIEDAGEMIWSVSEDGILSGWGYNGRRCSDLLVDGVITPAGDYHAGVHWMAPMDQLDPNDPLVEDLIVPRGGSFPIAGAVCTEVVGDDLHLTGDLFFPHLQVRAPLEGSFDFGPTDGEVGPLDCNLDIANAVFDYCRVECNDPPLPARDENGKCLDPSSP